MKWYFHIWKVLEFAHSTIQWCTVMYLWKYSLYQNESSIKLYKYLHDKRSAAGVTHYTYLMRKTCYRRWLKVDHHLSLELLFSLWEGEQVFNWIKVPVSCMEITLCQVYLFSHPRSHIMIYVVLLNPVLNISWNNLS